MLRGVYRYTPVQIAAALRRFAGTPRVTLENASLSAQALNWVEEGKDFADALHLSASGHCEAFVTFDTNLAEAARRARAGNVRTPWYPASGIVRVALCSVVGRERSPWFADGALRSALRLSPHPGRTGPSQNGIGMVPGATAC